MLRKCLIFLRGVVIALVVVYGLVVMLLSLPIVQHHVSEAVEEQLETLLHTHVSIEHITMGYPNRLVLDDVEIDDLEGKPLLRAARLSARFEWIPLLSHGRVSIHTAQIFGLHARISRTTIEDELNIQFLLDVFASQKQSEKSAMDLRINSLLVRRCDLHYDVASEEQTPGVFNPHHVAVNNINATMVLKALSRDSVNVQVKRLDMNEQSGFRLDGLQMHLLANTESISLHELDVNLPHSRLKFDTIDMNIVAEEGDSTAKRKMVVKGETLSGSYVTPSDIAPLVPALQYFDDELYLAARVESDGREWCFPDVQVWSSDNSVSLELDDVTLSLPVDSLDEIGIRAAVPMLKVTPEGIPYLWKNMMSDEKPMPEMVSRIGMVDFNGEVNGVLSHLNACGQLKTAVGEVRAKVNLRSLPEQTWVCKGHVETDSLNMYTLLGDEQELGVVALNLDFDMKKVAKNAPIIYLKGVVPTLQYKGYRYQQIAMDGNLNRKSFDGWASLEDPNITLRMDGHVGLGTIPSFDLTTRIEKFRPHDLLLTNTREGYEYAAVVSAHFSGNNPNNFEGTLCIDSLEARLPQDTFFLPQLIACAGKMNDGQNLITIESDVVQARIEGVYTYETLPTSFVQILGNYLPSLFGPKQKQVREADNEFNFDVKLNDSKFYTYVLDLPLKISPSATLKGFISNKQELVEVMGDVPHLEYKDAVYEIGNVRCYNSPERVMANFSISKQMANNTRVTMMVDAHAEDDRLSTQVSWGNDSPLTYAGSVEAETHFQMNSNKQLQAEVKIKPSEIIINDTIWDVAASTIKWDAKSTDIQGVGIRHGGQYLVINGRLTDKPTDSLVVDLSDVAIEYVLDVVRFKAVKFSGKATGKVYVNGALGDMKASTDLYVKDFHFNQGLLGDLDVSARWDDEIGVVLAGDIREADTLSHTKVSGFISPQQKGLDLNIEAENTNLSFLNSFIGGIFADVKGRGTGHVRLHGSFKELNLEGEAVANASLKPRILNTPFSIDKDSVVLTKDAIVFSNVSAKDVDGNPVQLSGKVTHQHLKDMGYDFHFNVDHACVYDTDDFGGMPFHGKVYASGNAHLYGEGNQLNLDGNVTSERGTTFVVNMSQPDALTDNYFVTFVDRTPRPNRVVVDNLRLFQHENEKEYVDGNPLQVFINANIDATPDANVRVIMDMRSGDHITANGAGSIQVNYTNESTTLRGNYVVESGQYKMSIQDLIRKDFLLQQGSEVIFTGNGGETELDIKAVHTVNSASLSDLVPEASFNQNTVKVNCIINMSGKLDAPTLNFDLELPTINEEERQLVRSAISTDEQMRTQIVYLLGVGKFYTFDYGTIEGQQSSNALTSILSSTLSGQLNNLLSQALNMNNWNFSSTLSTGQEGWSDLEVEGILSGSMLNNRLIINGNFGYRENQMRNSNFVGDFDVQYLFTPNFRAKGYSLTNDRYFAKQTFTTQGIGLIYKREFDNWRDFFRLKKK